jgi:hypothetical protein
MTRDVQGPDFVWKRSATDAEAVSLLVQRFPLLLELGESQEELASTGAFYAYGRLADQITQKMSDASFLSAAAEFINELTLSSDPFLEELAQTGVLEAIAGTPEIARELTKYLGEKAKAILRHALE